LTHDTFPGTSYLSYAFIGGLSISTALLVAPLATHLTGRYGTRFVLLLGVFFETLSFIGSSFVTEIWQLFLSQGVCFGWGMGFLFAASVGIIPQWFLKKRSLANSIAAAGSGFGGLTYSLAAQKMIDRISLAWSFRILGIVCFAVNFTCSMLLRDRNKAVGSRHAAFHLPLLKRPEFILLQGWAWFSMFGYVVLIFSLTNYAVSIGLTATQGSLIGALFNLGQGIGRPVVGLVSDRLGRINVATILTFICGLFCLVIWVFAKNLGVLVFFGILVGTVAGTFWTTIAPIGAEVVGLRDLPAALSLTWVFLVPPCTTSEPIGLALRSENASNVYLHCQLFTGFAYIAGTGCLWIVRGWKVGELERIARRKEIEERRATENRILMDVETLGEKQSSGGLPQSSPTSIEPFAAEKDNWKPKDVMRRMNAWRVV
jgi:MFS family permease